MSKYKFRPVLSLFDEGAGSGVTSSAAGSENGSRVADGSKQNAEDLSKVIYGKQSSDKTGAQGTEDKAAVNNSSVAGNDTSGTADTAGGSDEDFDALIKGPYKDAFNKRVKSIVDRRTKNSGELAKYKNDTQELLTLLAGKYGVNSDDISAVTKAVQEDDSFFEEAAYKEGMTIEQYKYKLKLEKENEALRNEKQRAETERAASERLKSWYDQAEKLTGLYPEFNLETEAKNPGFVKLLQSGIDVRTAYEVIHNDEIVNGAMRITADAVKKQVTDNIRARGMRPAENGSGASAATIVKKDPSKFTKEDRAEIARRARRGEVIEL